MGLNSWGWASDVGHDPTSAVSHEAAGVALLLAFRFDEPRVFCLHHPFAVGVHSVHRLHLPIP